MALSHSERREIARKAEKAHDEERVATIRRMADVLDVEFVDDAAYWSRLAELAEAPESPAWVPESGDGAPLAFGEPFFLGAKKVRVVAVSHRGKACVRPWPAERGGGGWWVEASELSRERPDSWKRVMEDAKAIDEGLRGFSRNVSTVSGIVRRCKALARSEGGAK